MKTNALEIIAENDIVRAVKCSNGITYNAPTVILTAGTFLRGMMHIGTHQFEGGRLDEPASNELSDSLMKIGLELGRLKTGTPARLDAKTIDYDKIEIQILLRTVQKNWPDAVGMGKTQCGKVYIDMNGLPRFDNQLWWLNANYMFCM